MITTPVALLMVLTAALPCLGLAAWRLARIRRRRRGPEIVTSAGSCPHMQFSAGCQVISLQCGICGPVPVQLTSRRTVTA